MRVLLVAAGPPFVAAARTRVFQYIPSLLASGIEARVIPFYSAAVLKLLEREPGPRLAARSYTLGQATRIAAVANRFDLVVWQRTLLPEILLRPLRARARRLIFDVDDAIYAAQPDERASIDSLRRRMKRFDMIAATSDAVIASTLAIARHARRVQPHTHELLSPVDTDRFRPKPQRSSGPTTIGWIGSPSTSCYLREVIPTLMELSRRSDVHVMLVGAQIPDLDDRIEQHPWQQDREIEDLSSMDVGIMPLASDEWSQSKGAYKALQYQASGAACVASAVGAANEIIQHGDNGLLVSASEQWRSAISRLIDDEPFRSKLAWRARQTVEERHSLRASGPRFIEILRTVAESAD